MDSDKHKHKHGDYDKDTHRNDNIDTHTQLRVRGNRRCGLAAVCRSSAGRGRQGASFGFARPCTRGLLGQACELPLGRDADKDFHFEHHNIQHSHKRNRDHHINEYNNQIDHNGDKHYNSNYHGNHTHVHSNSFDHSDDYLCTQHNDDDDSATADHFETQHS
mmetsp:Transcript_45512/g.114643  ORF Transcript_45512/g.114643 Transcript_45512/m.114643 type:complete len:162 (-) Transcript_45512:391-876(-)